MEELNTNLFDLSWSGEKNCLKEIEISLFTFEQVIFWFSFFAKGNLYASEVVLHTEICHILFVL